MLTLLLTALHGLSTDVIGRFSDFKFIVVPDKFYLSFPSIMATACRQNKPIVVVQPTSCCSFTGVGTFTFGLVQNNVETKGANIKIN